MFQATWQSAGKGGTTVVLAQSPPRRGFKVGGVAVVLGPRRHSFFCSARVCLDEHGRNPLAGLLRLYDGSAFVATVQAIRRGSVISFGGTRVAFAREVDAGLGSTCATITVRAATATWCLSTTGVVTRWSTRGGGFQLTAYSTTPDSALLLRPR
jgi:hypothetical protein